MIARWYVAGSIDACRSLSRKSAIETLGRAAFSFAILAAWAAAVTLIGAAHADLFLLILGGLMTPASVGLLAITLGARQALQNRYRREDK